MTERHIILRAEKNLYEICENLNLTIMIFAGSVKISHKAHKEYKVHNRRWRWLASFATSIFDSEKDTLASCLIRLPILKS